MPQIDTSDKNAPKVRKLDLSNKAVQRGFEALPEKVRDRFLFNLAMVCQGLEPVLKHQKLRGPCEGVIELKINGSPAYRCMYAVRKSGDVVVLHVTSKTTQGQDKQLMATTAERLKQLGQDQV
ncbi:type II toxin-antitoxin system RelE/ParE family toxin [Xanthomonas campestris pv. campestris]|uniref:type II toxin-antitoxin system RelE/ParE family toxin n=1 Tax=Xanthomonas campestris TaxID=339 RepID=UPI0025A2D936|nr:type II toxin-antitoxin system RelE/ParE family toxin [Xanthomonas campestris]MDM7714759.1 type II toxin-antitoxin system RelE/ParE family toxin [Xanthomonas campestris pv. campestris]MEB2027359.1 type II toxin-antitoxin system RelE/ParE family toxin [Xanthomonas campestris pv. campestris]